MKKKKSILEQDIKKLKDALVREEVQGPFFYKEHLGYEAYGQYAQELYYKHFANEVEVTGKALAFKKLLEELMNQSEADFESRRNHYATQIQLIQNPKSIFERLLDEVSRMWHSFMSLFSYSSRKYQDSVGSRDSVELEDTPSIATVDRSNEDQSHLSSEVDDKGPNNR